MNLIQRLLKPLNDKWVKLCNDADRYNKLAMGYEDKKIKEIKDRLNEERDERNTDDIFKYYRIKRK